MYKTNNEGKEIAVAEIDVSSHEEQSVSKRSIGRTARVAPTLPATSSVMMNTKDDQVVIDINDSEKLSANFNESKPFSLLL